MDEIKVIGGQVLSGKINISGAKNSVVALIPAAILCDKSIISNVPHISDVDNLEKILKYLDVDFSLNGDTLSIDTINMVNKPIDNVYSKKLRASYYFMGALLGRFKRVEISLPGGCVIGKRPMDIHFSGFEALGATVKNEGDLYIIEAPLLKGADIDLKFASVGATVNILLASVKACGVTRINNAAIEPEIGNLIDFLNSMGAKISGKDTRNLVIEGVDSLSFGNIRVIPGRIEAGTYILAGVMNGKKLEVCNMCPEHLTSFLDVLKEMGASLEIKETSVVASKVDNLKPVNIKTEVYPGFPTDLQQPITTLLLMANGKSVLKETIYENRFQNVEYLNKMGASILVSGDTIYVSGPVKLQGKLVKTSDLRAGAALILAALSADGETTITDIKHLLRGYSDLIAKLTNVGAKIWLTYE